MSFLDMDEWLIELASMADVVYGPVVDYKQYPENVDVCLIEGAIANTDNLELVHIIRARTRALAAFGDCAVTGNVTAMRNPLGTAEPVLSRSYLDGANLKPHVPRQEGIVPSLLDQVLPVHKVVPVEYFLTGCPPSARRIRTVLEEIIAGRAPQLSGEDLRFG